MSKPHEAYMSEALCLAHAGMDQQAGGPFGAVIVHDGKIIGSGYNRVLADCDPTAHAEVVAIREACKTLGQFHLTGCDLYTTCEPCPMCLAAAYWAHLRCIYYASTRQDAAQAGFDDAFIYEQLALPPEQRSLSFVKLDYPPAADAMTRWINLPGKTDY